MSMSTEVEVEDTAADIEARTAWWELGREDAAPEAVQALYADAKLPQDVRLKCEQARKRMGSGYFRFEVGAESAMLLSH
jgi:hypothetical protein